MLVVSDGSSEDNVNRVTNILHDKMHVKIAAMVWRSYNKEKLLPLTRYEGAIFTKDETEAISIWIWRQQVLKLLNFFLINKIPFSKKNYL